ncbi:catalase-peroxidase [Microdochium nivale]|nr:catalase-peroxidase [Microdochium nivale]
MTMRPAEARVPQMFLDTYEEMEEWVPYIDPSQPAESQSPLLGFRARPAYAVSVFGALIRLSHKTERITQAFYSINCVKRSQGDVAEVKADIERDLSSWLSTLPEHLRFDPRQSPCAVPPPHQITPHTTYHTLNILLQRPFIEGGYLQDKVTWQEREINEKKCVDSALAIWKLVDAYRTGLTLRRAPFLLSYAVYSAVVVILRQSKKEQQQQQRSQSANSVSPSQTDAGGAGVVKAAADRFREPINFFWTALSELQRGCNFGLRKPVAIIRDMMDELGDIVPQLEHPPADGGGLTLFERMLEMCGSSNDQQQQQHQGWSLGGGRSRDTAQEGIPYQQQVGVSDMSGMGGGGEYHQYIGVSGSLDNNINNNSDSSADNCGGISAAFEPTPPGFLEFLDDTEQTITNDTLYGLFAEQPSWF